jgi:hypothetical protein
MSREQQNETAFLRRCLRYDESAAGRHLEERIAQVQGKSRCLSRARWLVALLAALAVAGLGYAAVFQDRFPEQAFVFTTQFITNAIRAVCLGSLISLLSFTGLGLVYGWELNRLRDEGRQFVTRFLESRLGQPRATNQNGHSKEHEPAALHGEMAAPVSERGSLSPASQASVIPGLPGRVL